MEGDTRASSVFPYLRSCKKETEENLEGEIQGEIPKWLKGNLIRVGTGLLEVGPDHYNHIFDGLALLHQFSFEDGKVTYKNRFLRSDTYRKNMKANRIVVSEFGTPGVPDPCKTIFQRFASLFKFDEMTDNDLVNIVPYSTEYFASSEVSSIWKIDPDSLESVRKVQLDKYLPVNSALAHAHIEPDGTVYNIGTQFGLCPTYNVIKFPPSGENEKSSTFENSSVICKIPCSKLLNFNYYHSFGITENYIIFVEQPLYFYMPTMAWAHFFAGAYSDAMYWKNDKPTRFHIVRRSDNQLLKTRYLTKAFFVFHHINAYEEDNHLVVDMCTYDRGDVVQDMYVKALEDKFSDPKKMATPFQTTANRYVLPLTSQNEQVKGKNLVTLSKCTATAVSQPNGSIVCEPETLTGDEPWSPELPRINYENFNGKKYRYFYAMAQNRALKRVYLIKVDTESRTTLSWGEEGVIPSEPVFIQNADSPTQDEDSGVILASLLYVQDESKVSLIVLDAKTMKELGKATFKTLSSVPGDFHGVFVPKL